MNMLTVSFGILGSFACCKGKPYACISICCWEATIASVFCAAWCNIIKSQWVTIGLLAHIYIPAAAPETGSSAPATCTLGTMLGGKWQPYFKHTALVADFENKLCPILNYFTLYVTVIFQAVPCSRRLILQAASDSVLRQKVTASLPTQKVHHLSGTTHNRQITDYFLE